MKTTNNTILITGGGSGIGRGLAEAFHALGNQVVISGRTKKSLDEVTSANPGIKSLTLDVADAKDVESFATRVINEFPKLNVLFNNAGMMHNENLLSDAEQHLGDVEETIATNLLGPIRLTAALLPHLEKQPEATILNVTSGLAYVPLAMTPTYCATKAAIHSYTQSLRYQLKDTKIEVKELIPPYVATTLMGERQANDPQAMPLDDFIKEVMDIFKTQLNATEIAVERVRPLRFAAEGGMEKYNQFFKQFNDRMAAARPNG
jgi:uncharacterized oxidoreductase